MTEKVLALTDQQELIAHGRRNLLASGLGTAFAGALILCAGYVMLANSPAIASGFFGADLAFGLPITETDALRVQASAFGSSMVLAFGALAVAVGVVLMLRGRGAASGSRQADRI